MSRGPTNLCQPNPALISKSPASVAAPPLSAESSSATSTSACFGTVRYPASRIRHAALIEDEESIQVALMETINALLLGTLDIKRAELILRALNTAVRNARRVNFGLHSDDMVREIPDYPTPPLEQVDEQYAKELRLKEERAETARAREEMLAQYQSTQNKAKPSESCGDEPCGDGSQTRPGGPEVPGRSAVPPKPVQAKRPKPQPASRHRA